MKNIWRIFSVDMKRLVRNPFALVIAIGLCIIPSLIEVVEKMDSDILGMAKSTTGSDVGTGGMATKLTAAKIATLSGTDMIIANGADVCVLHHIFDDSFRGTIFKAQKKETFRIQDFILETIG